MDLTATQSKLWKLADNELIKIGGIASIRRNPDSAVRAAAKTEGTYEWALVESARLASPANDEKMSDKYCQKLINIIAG